MKSTIKYLVAASLLMAATGCIEETFPNSNRLTYDQLDSSDPKVMEGYASAIISQMAKTGTYYLESYVDIGYPGLGIVRDCYGMDYPVYASSYDYFYYYAANLYLGEYAYSGYFWTYPYSLVMQCNNLLRLKYSDATAAYFATAYGYRALFYLDMARTFEFKPTGYPELDANAAELHGLTVPIITETTTEEEAKSCPRAEYTDMYGFIISDLNKAADILQNTSVASKDMMSIYAVNGLRARAYIEVAAHMRKYPEDLAGVTAEKGFAATTVQGLYEKAAEYADLAIAGGSPLTEEQWYGGSTHATGFNSVIYPSWLLGFTINKELLEASWWSYAGYTFTESLFSLAGLTEENGVYANTYKQQRMISADLYASIPEADWRRSTWIDPADAGNADAVGKYPTIVNGDFFAALPAYTNFKFHPTAGDLNDYSVGAAVDYPMMRVEEMYFIKAEAEACAHGVAAGKQVLEGFVNGFRYTDGSYKCNASSLDDFLVEMLRQKRIELWGEGLIAFDLKRLDQKVYRCYEGSNFADAYKFNSLEGYCAPWLNGYILQSEIGRNPAIKANPDPSTVKGVTY